MKQLSDQQAYLAMFAFLDGQFQSTKSSDLGALLSSMSLLPDGEPADPAVKAEWQAAIAVACSGCVNASAKFS